MGASRALEGQRKWIDREICDALAWYLDVAENSRPAKFRIASTVPTNVDPAQRMRPSFGPTSSN